MSKGEVRVTGKTQSLQLQQRPYKQRKTQRGTTDRRLRHQLTQREQRRALFNRLPFRYTLRLTGKVPAIHTERRGPTRRQRRRQGGKRSHGYGHEGCSNVSRLLSLTSTQ